MKWVLRVAFVLALLVALGLGALAVALPRIVDSDAVRGRIEGAARDVLGRDLRYRDLDFGLLPPSLLVVAPEIAGESPGDPPLVRAERVDLRVALLPLLARRIVVDSLVVEGASLNGVRTSEGLQLPRPKAAAGPPARGAAAEPPGGGEGGAGGGGGIALAVRRVVLRDATVQLDDRAVSPEVSWRVEVPRLEATGTRPGAPVALAGSLALASGGEIGVSGDAGLDGTLDLELSLRDLELAPLDPYLRGAVPDLRLEGRLGGRVKLVGPAANPSPLSLELEIPAARLRAAGVEALGPLALEAEVASPATRPTGRFRIDASAARIAYGSDFSKPAGTPAVLEGRLVADASGALGVEDLAFALRNLVLRGSVGTTPKLRADLAAEPFELAGWEELVPALSGTALRGALALPRLSVAAVPLRVEGSMRLQDVVVALPDRAPITLRGSVDAEGTTLRSRELQLVAADQPLRVEATIDDVARAPRFRVELGCEHADANALLAALAGRSDTLYGLLDLKGELRGQIAERPLLETLTGRLGFDIPGGRIVGVSLLEAVFAKLGALSVPLLDAGRVFGGRDLQRFYGDDFERMLGKLRIADGDVLADELSLVYRGYGVELAGSLGLSDLSLDLRGTLTLDEELDAEIAHRAGLGDRYVARRRQIPLAAVGGSLEAPEVRLQRNAALQFAAAYARDAYRDELGRRVDKELGPEAGEAARRGLEVLEGILGGKQRR